MRKFIRRPQIFIPLIVFLVLAIFLWLGLSKDPRRLPSALINKPAPEFSLKTINYPNRRFTNKDLIGHVSIVNVWATWCETCYDEHKLLLEIARKYHIVLYGLDYKDDMKKARRWIKEFGNPYQMIGFDENGSAAINWGVYGTPETFVVDKKGIVRYKHVGALTKTKFITKILPLIKELKS